MNVRKAVIPVAGRGLRSCGAGDAVPQALLPLVDRDGLVKPVVQIIAEEAIDSGIEEIVLVTAPGEEAVYRRCFPGARSADHAARASVVPGQQTARLADVGRRLRYVTQEQPAGFGHAVWCARDAVGSEPFLLLVGDHLCISGEDRRCAREVLDLAAEQQCSVAAVQATREHLIHRFGTVAGRRFAGFPNVFQIERIIEKPTPSVAEQQLHVSGLRVGHYLCFFGMQVITPAIFDILGAEIERHRPDEGVIQLTPAMQELAKRERFLAVQVNGRRYDVGNKYGLLEAQVALAMSGVDRDDVLARMIELLLHSAQDQSAAAVKAAGHGSTMAGTTSAA